MINWGDFFKNYSARIRVALFTQLNGIQESNKASKEAYLGTSAVFLDFGMTCIDVTSAAFTLG
jgi:hypothetical protein